MYEEDLHKIFKRYPYLIVNEPKSIIRTIHEYELDSNSIPDIYIETNNRKFYCEIKISKLKERDLYQAIRYLNTIENNLKSGKARDFSVILIGMRISNQLRIKANQNGIIIKLIGTDIPDSIKICKKCRKAYNARHFNCDYCSSNEILEIIIIKYP